jgi:hypothetical protein
VSDLDIAELETISQSSSKRDYPPKSILASEVAFTVSG